MCMPRHEQQVSGEFVQDTRMVSGHITLHSRKAEAVKPDRSKEKAKLL
jgi:hypothetical protein